MWVFKNILCATIYNRYSSKITDITKGNRPAASVTNVNDPGGRLGPYVGKEGSADLRNLGLFTILCHPGDLIMILSDGVYDNLDPQQLNVPCAEVGLQSDDWEQADPEEAEKAKDSYRCNFIANRLKPDGGDKEFTALAEFVDALLTHTRDVTEYSRKWMEEHPTARMPDARSKKRDPSFLGKMDHSTVVVTRVGFKL